MSTDRARERDLILSPNEFAFILDETKGNINVYVGPHKTSLANTDAPVVFDAGSKKFDRRQLDAAIQRLSIAPEGWYIVLKNPASDKSQPRTGALNNLPALDAGRKINIPGPASFALWPGQMARVIQGHHLRSNQYLIVRVYDEESAKTNWKNAVLRPRTDGESDISNNVASPPDLTMGKLHIIKGTEVSFYMPPTGVEVVADDNEQFIRDAVTLERLEYCILLDENGTKRYIQGPDVVFPSPTETFISHNNSNKFRAIELNENTGLYLKVIAPYEEDGRRYKVGDELFITGKDMMIYFPRQEHAIIKYGDQDRHFGIAIPSGEARYVLDRQKGAISLAKGPQVFLPDPRAQVIVRRVLSEKDVLLWYPGNHEALDWNRRLAGQTAEDATPTAMAMAYGGNLESMSMSDAPSRGLLSSKGRGSSYGSSSYVHSNIPKSPELAGGDNFNRGTKHTEPRTVILNTKYEGAVAINIWTGYAVMVVGKTGARRVETGPKTCLLEYDESLQAMELSTGTPKNDANLARTVYLRISNNKLSDVVQAETSDLVKVSLNVSYRVNFEGDPNKWFEVENYVKFLCDHIRSLLRAGIRKHGIEEFYRDSTTIVRNLILGSPGEDSKRPGRSFVENGMRIYDVELLNVTIGDKTISDMLSANQHQVVQQALRSAEEERRLEVAKLSERTRRESHRLKEETELELLQHQATRSAMVSQIALADLQAKATLIEAQESARRQSVERTSEISQIELARREAEETLNLRLDGLREELRKKGLEADAEAIVAKARAISPDLIAALQAFGDKDFLAKVSESMGPMALIGGESVVDVITRLFRGMPILRGLGLALPEGDGKNEINPPRA